MREISPGKNSLVIVLQMRQSSSYELLPNTDKNLKAVKMRANPDIFKAYDIRGIYPVDLNEDIAYSIGRAFVSYVKVGKVIVGRDMRLSSPQMSEALACGLMEQGADVINIGMVSTDQYYHACATLGLPGIVVTASHNPAQYSGFKMVKKMPQLLSGDEGIQEIQRIIAAEQFPKPTHRGRMTYEDLREIGRAHV